MSAGKGKRKKPKRIQPEQVPEAIAKMKQGGPRVVAVVRLKGVGRGK
jgi:hypothetical protein